jgi:very-short-patch-repair endonuclease
VFDVAELSRRLLIELDGGVHRLPEVAARDAAKTAWASAHGYALLRLPNAAIWSAPDRVIDQIRAFRAARR